MYVKREKEREREERDLYVERSAKGFGFSWPFQREREKRAKGWNVTIFCLMVESNVTHVLVTCRMFIVVSKYRCTKPINPPGPS